MVFSSSVFLLVFLPLVLVAYFIVPGRAAKNCLLLLASLVFYAWGEPTYIVLMVVSIFANWLFGVLIDRASEAGTRKTLLIFDLVVNLALLCFFKYEGFLAENINALLGSSVIPDLELPLPIGISFYTLQAVSYVIDVYRREVPAQRNIVYLGMYIAMFPQLVAGPIVRYSTIQEQVLHRKETLKGFCSGLRLFCVGLAKKVLLANVVAILAAKMLKMGGAEIGLVGAWAGLIAYTFQIYFDFGGYSDMAIGLGKMFGFQYLRNFNYPYLSKSATEFWRRWHISLSTFFRDYIYIPLGGSRVTTKRWIFNIGVVWALTGLWHGAAWNFVLWGLFYGVMLVLEKQLILKHVKRLPGVLQHLYGIVIFMFGWLLFWVEDMNAMGEYLLAMFGAFGLSGSSTLWELTAWEYVPVFAACALASTPVVPWLRAKFVAWAEGRKVTRFLELDLPNQKRLGTKGLCEMGYDASKVVSKSRLATLECVALAVDFALLLMLLLSIGSVVSGSFNPFIYFRF